MLSVIFRVEREWQAIDDRNFGIGNISVRGGRRFLTMMIIVTSDMGAAMKFV